MTPNNFRVKNGLTVSNGIVVEAGVISGNGSSITSVNAATLNGNTAAQLRAYTDSSIGTSNTAIVANASAAYTNATAFSANASNISSGTLAFARLPALYLGTTAIQSTSAAQAVSGITTLAAGNTTITGFANVSTTLQVGTNTVTFGTAAYLVSNGNFGLGTSTPIRPAHVYYNSSVVGAYTAVLQGATGGYGAGVSFQSVLTGGALAEMARITADGEAAWDTTAANQDAGLRFYTALNGTVTEKMRLNSSGNFLINRTGESGLGKLNCEGGADFTGGNVYLGRDTGNVAIGTTTATSKLYIKSSGSNIIAAELASNANTIFKVYESAGDGYLEVLSGASSPVSKLSGYTGTPTYFLSNTGIGNTAPTDKLSVNGTTYLQGVTTLAANLVMANNNITRPVLTGYTEAEVANTAATGTWTMDCGAANFFDLTLTGNITISPTNVPPSTRVWSGSIAAKQDATGGRTITWPTGTKWPGGVAPPATTTANAIDIWSVMTYDGGTTWIASLSVKNAS